MVPDVVLLRIHILLPPVRDPPKVAEATDEDWIPIKELLALYMTSEAAEPTVEALIMTLDAIARPMAIDTEGAVVWEM